MNGVDTVAVSYTHLDVYKRQGNSRVNTTLAKQLANWVILYSPLQLASDMIEHYEGHPAFQFFRDFDPDCDRCV